MALDPRFVVLDEPTSALDMSIQAQIVDLLRDLQRRRNLAYLFISHDLRVVRALASDIIVMRRGKVVESGEAREVFRAPQNDYTRALFAAAFANEATLGRREPVKSDGSLHHARMVPSPRRRDHMGDIKACSYHGTPSPLRWSPSPAAARHGRMDGAVRDPPLRSGGGGPSEGRWRGREGP